MFDLIAILIVIVAFGVVTHLATKEDKPKPTINLANYPELLAYKVYEYRKELNLPGDALSDWLLAENIINKYNKQR